MESERLDLLVIGGQQEALVANDALQAKQLSFTLEGLLEAPKYVKWADTVVVIPDKDILVPGPVTEELEKFIQPIEARMGAKRLSGDPLPLHLIEHLASKLLLEVLGFTFVLVNSGAEVYVFFPEKEAEGSDKLLGIISESLPGIYIGKRPLWPLDGKEKWHWLLSGVKSDIFFDIKDEEATALIEEGLRHISQALPRPDEVFGFWPLDHTNISYHYDGGAKDRAGSYRVLAFGWGKGSFILAPGGCLPAIVERLNEKKTVPTLPDLPPPPPAEEALREAPSQVSTHEESLPEEKSSSAQKVKEVPRKRKYERAPDIGFTKKQKVFELWKAYKEECKVGKGELKLPEKPTYIKCFNENEPALKELGITTLEDFKKTCDSVRKNWDRRQ